MTAVRKDRICALLKGIETGDPDSVLVVNPDQYIQHNPETREGGEGLAELFERLSKTSPRVNIVRVFADGDYVFAHTEYDFGSPRIGFEIFRFEGAQTVEHWDNIQPREGPNPCAHDMVDGPTAATDLEHTEANRETVRGFVAEVLIGGRLDALEDYVAVNGFTEHNPRRGDDLAALRAALTAPASGRGAALRYHRMHRILAEGNFVLSVSEGSVDAVPTSFYDLFRVDGGKIVEHWDTTEAIPQRSAWKNDNGKF